MDQRSWLEGLSRVFAGQFVRGETAQFGVNERKQLLCGLELVWIHWSKPVGIPDPSPQPSPRPTGKGRKQGTLFQSDERAKVRRQPRGFPLSPINGERVRVRDWEVRMVTPSLIDG